MYYLHANTRTLSYKNNWIDENGRVYIYFTVEETTEQLGCGIKKAVKLIKNLEEIGLMEKKRGGQEAIETEKADPKDGPLEPDPNLKGQNELGDASFESFLPLLNFLQANQA